MATNENLATMSNTLIYSAMLVYTGALGAFTTDLALRGRAVVTGTAASDGAATVDATAGAAAVDATAVEAARVGDAAVPADARRVPQTVPAGVDGPIAAASVDLSSESAATAGTTSTLRPSGRATAATSATGVPGGQGREPGRGTPLKTKAGGIGVSLTILAFLLHVGSVTARGLSVHRVPWGNMYEFSLAGSAVVIGMFLVVLARRDVRYLGTFVVGPVLLMLGLAVTVFYTRAAQLVPALHSFWLLIHVSVAFIASALYTLAFSTTVLQLVQERREIARAAGRPPVKGRFMDALPSSAALDRSSYSLHIAAFPLWTFTVLAGAIWAESAWGRYWNWDPKETWSFVIWVVYAGHLHARATRGWDGRRAAYFALAGYFCVLMNFMVVNVFFVGLHSYGGL